MRAFTAALFLTAGLLLGCSSNPLQSVSSAGAALKKAVTTSAATQAAGNLTQAQAASITQLSTAYHLTPQQTSNIQTYLKQGTDADQKSGLSAELQSENTTKRLTALQLLLGNNPNTTGLKTQ